MAARDDRPRPLAGSLADWAERCASQGTLWLVDSEQRPLRSGDGWTTLYWFYWHPTGRYYGPYSRVLCFERGQECIWRWARGLPVLGGRSDE